MSNFILRGLRRLDSKSVRKNGIWTYFDTSLVLFSFIFVALSMYIYISNFREHPMYPEIENIKCDTATLLPAGGGNKFNTRDRKLYRLSNGKVLKASFSMKLPVEKDKAPPEAKYYTSAVSNDDFYFVCYVLLEDVKLSSYHQIVYFSDVYELELSESYLKELAEVFLDFKQKPDVVGYVSLVGLFSVIWGVFFGVLAVISEKYIKSRAINYKDDSNGE